MNGQSTIVHSHIKIQYPVSNLPYWWQVCDLQTNRWLALWRILVGSARNSTQPSGQCGPVLCCRTPCVEQLVGAPTNWLYLWGLSACHHRATFSPFSLYLAPFNSHALLAHRSEFLVVETRVFITVQASPQHSTFSEPLLSYVWAGIWHDWWGWGPTNSSYNYWKWMEDNIIHRTQ